MLSHVLYVHMMDAPMVCIAQAADIFGTGLVAGAFVMGAFAVHPAAARLDPAPHVLLRQELIPPALSVPAALHVLARTEFTLRTGALSDIGIAAARRARLHAFPGHYCDHGGGQRAAQPTLCDLVSRRVAS